jgi:NitT/TauT family transport system substrate-binding protein
MVVSYAAVIPAVLPEWIADAAGIYKKHGLDVELTYIESSKGMASLIAGQIQVTGLGAAEVVSAVAAGADVVPVTTNAPVYPYLLQVAPDIKTTADLKGKKIGVSSPGSVSDIATRVALRKVGLDPDKDVSIIAVGSASNRLAAMDSGAIQGGLSFPPESLVLESKGFHTIIDMTKLDAPWSNASDILLRSYIKDHHDVVQRYVDSIVEAIGRGRTDRALAIDVLRKYHKIDDQKTLDATYDYFVGSVIPALPYPKPEQFADAKAILGEKNAAVASFDAVKAIDDSFVKSAAERGLDKQ